MFEYQYVSIGGGTQSHIQYTVRREILALVNAHGFAKF